MQNSACFSESINFHNHGFDFKLCAGVLPFEELLRLTDSELVAIQMDCGWVASAGYDPVNFFERYPGRVQLLHIKDLIKKAPTTDFDMQSVAVGNGSIDWRHVLSGARAGGVNYGFVELEPPFISPPLEQFKVSYDFLTTLKF